MQFTFKLFAVAVLLGAFTQVGCSGGGNNSPAATVSTSSSVGFYSAYGACFSSATGQPVDYSNCANSGAGTVYTTSPGVPTICCASGSATSFADIGSGTRGYHGIAINYPVVNCCTAWEVNGNGGSMGCRITCQ